MSDKKFVCCICGKESVGYGNDPEPINTEGRCCDKCNELVIRARYIKYSEYLRNRNKNHK